MTIPERRSPQTGERRVPSTAMKFEQAISILAAFEREQVRYVLIGSMAMAAQGIIRATRDVDFFVAPDPLNVDRIKRALRAVYDDASIDDIDADDLGGLYPVIRYGPPEGDFVIDFVARIGDAFAFDDIESEELVVEGVTVRVATPRMLWAFRGGMMPVRKMRTIAEAEMPPAPPLRGENLRSAFELSEACLRLRQSHTPRGVRRFRSLEAAQDRDTSQASPAAEASRRPRSSPGSSDSI